MADTTVSIVAFRTPSDVMERAVSCALRDGARMVVIVDHAASDELRQLAASFPADRVHYMRLPNRGFGAGHNAAIRYVLPLQPDFHVVMNPDVYWNEPVLPALAAAMNAMPEVGMMVPRVRYPNGELQQVARLLPSPLDLLIHRAPDFPLWRRRARRATLCSEEDSTVCAAPFFHGCFMFIRTTALAEAGLFDERFFLYLEDADLSRRIHALRPTLYNPGVQIFHAHAAASRKSLRMMLVHARSAVRYFSKWGWFADAQRRRFNRAVANRR